MLVKRLADYVIIFAFDTGSLERLRASLVFTVENRSASKFFIRVNRGDVEGERSLNRPRFFFDHGDVWVDERVDALENREFILNRRTRSDNCEVVVTLAFVAIEFLSLSDVPTHQGGRERPEEFRVLVDLVKHEVLRFGDEPLLLLVFVDVEQSVVDRIRIG
ncbi:hypothetical protein [Haladaptatus sp. ZSTT2]|uniref:hypothetical protein n=1 Tax=Haladaptatus sp. ZSTT2 TaxID=3120515 RepID=UPI00300EC2D0